MAVFYPLNATLAFSVASYIFFYNLWFIFLPYNFGITNLLIIQSVILLPPAFNSSLCIKFISVSSVFSFHFAYKTETSVKQAPESTTTNYYPTYLLKSFILVDKWVIITAAGVGIDKNKLQFGNYSIAYLIELN